MGDLLLPIAVVEPGVVLSRDGAMSATWRFRGPDLASETHRDMAVINNRTNELFARLGNGWMLQVEAMRYPSPGYCPKGHFPDSTTAMIDEERRQQFLAEGEHYETEYFLTTTYLPPFTAHGKLKPWLFEGQAEPQGGNAQRALDQFTKVVGSLEDGLSTVLSITRLTSARTTDESGREVVYNDQLRFIRRCITGIDHPFVEPDIPVYLNDLLCPEDFVGGLVPRLGGRHIRVIAIEGFPKASQPAILGILGNLPLAYRWSTRAILLDRESGIHLCDKARAQWHGQLRPLVDRILQRVGGPVNLYAQDMVDDAEILRGGIASGEVRLVHYSGNVVCMHQDLARVEADAAYVAKTIQSMGFGARIEDLNAVEALLGTFPADGYRNVRRFYLHSLNLVDLIPTTSIWAGSPENPSPLMPPHSPPLLYAQTTGSTPFRLNLHASGDVGHTLVIGPTGSGKSTFLATLAAQWRRYPDAQVFVFDKGRGMFALTKACGGESYDIGGKTGLSFCPLSDIKGSNDIAWAVDYFEALCVLQGLTLNPEHRAHLTAAVARSCAKPSPGITELCIEVQDGPVRQALQNYTITGANGHLLDAQCDMLRESKFVSFEMENLMEMGPKAIVPVLLYLFRRIEQRLDGSPTLIVLDEAWLYLQQELFRERIWQWLRVLRKANAVVILSTQAISDIYKSPIRDVVLEACATKIFLPNAEAMNPASREFYDSVGLNDREIQMVQNALPKRDYYCVSRDGRRMISLGLGKVALSFVGVNGSEQRNAVEKLMSRYPVGWQAEWLRMRGLEDWAVYFEQLENDKKASTL
ncbi:MAG TPA: conjugal transfer protein TrbE [Terriglobia bacterium]|nr:conjugal transfer protein TrbE [Terriglobia bacterium]